MTPSRSRSGSRRCSAPRTRCCCRRSPISTCRSSRCSPAAGRSSWIAARTRRSTTAARPPRRGRRAQRRGGMRLRDARQQRRAPPRRELRQPHPRRWLLKGLLLAARVHRLPDRDQAGAQDGRPALPVLGPVAGGLAGHRAGGAARQRAARRAAARHAAPADRARAGSRRRARHRHAQPLGLSDRRDPARGRRQRRRRRQPAVRPRHLRDDGGVPARPARQVGFRLQLTSANTDEQIDHLCDVLGELAERFQLQSAVAEA